jgi:hypothetical protein
MCDIYIIKLKDSKYSLNTTTLHTCTLIVQICFFNSSMAQFVYTRKKCHVHTTDSDISSALYITCI